MMGYIADFDGKFIRIMYYPKSGFLIVSVELFTT